jgi:adenine-specific DNA-methyltransferase
LVEPTRGIGSEADLVALALGLGAETAFSLTPAEKAIAKRRKTVPKAVLAEARAAIRRGQDPLGDAFATLRSPRERRPLGATYTPLPIVRAMAAWGARRTPARVVDPGAGSGRFLIAAGRAMPDADLIAVEIDPVAALLTRANIATAGLGARTTVIVGDFRRLALAPISGATLFLGNPPYVRHHGIAAEWKRWLTTESRRLGFRASQLAGLHVHFFLATALHANPAAGDYGVLLTAAEWLDVNYGALVRELLLGPLGGESIHLLDPTLLPFADADTTAAITCFSVGSFPAAVHLRRVRALEKLAPLEGGRAIARARLAGKARWSPSFDAAPSPSSRPRSKRASSVRDLVPLGELCRVHRGQVTGANAVWIAGAHSAGVPTELLFPTVTHARELFAAGSALHHLDGLARVIDLPVDLDLLDPKARRAVERFLRTARSMGADNGFVARNRRAWWSVGLRAPAPILATYMARRPPAFVRNLAGARHINIAHGLYPRAPLTERQLDALAAHLSRATTLADGRTYAGGLTKFEPREMERLLVPIPKGE